MLHERGPLQMNFDDLASNDEEFGVAYRQNGSRMDFHDARLQKLLTKATMRQKFGIKIDLPDDRLCPPVPGRWEYIDFLLGLIESTPIDPGHLESEDARTVLGIDIGCGASCIYPLLGCAVRPNWRFGATEIDKHSFDCASRNVQLNEMQSQIRVMKVSEGAENLLDLDGLGIQRAHFVMCNPPFYNSVTEMKQSFLEKKQPPSAVCTGAPVELVAEGGDFGFALRLHKESLELENRVQWFTCLLGKLESANALVQAIKNSNTDNFAVARLNAGGKTHRWVVAWSYMDIRPDIAVIRGPRSVGTLQPPTTVAVVEGVRGDAEYIGKLLEELLAIPDIQWKWNATKGSGLFGARKDAWSRRARRERSKLSNAGQDTENSRDEPYHALVVKVSVLPAAEQVTLRWLKGRDFALFESFAGMLRRSLSRRRTE